MTGKDLHASNERKKHENIHHSIPIILENGRALNSSKLFFNRDRRADAPACGDHGLFLTFRGKAVFSAYGVLVACIGAKNFANRARTA